MIDFDLEMKNIQPIIIEDIESTQYRGDDNIKKSIILYNKAIAEIKIKDLDSAIKDLKKSLSYNEDFVEGIKLLGLCYAKNKKYRMAEKTFRQLAEYEEYSELAMGYIKNSIIERTMFKTMKSIERHDNSSSDKKEEITLKEHTKRKVIIGSSIAIIIAVFTISYWVGVNLGSNSKKDQITNKVVDSSKNKIDKASEEDNSLGKEDAVLNGEDKNIDEESDNTKYEANNNKDDALSILNEAEKSYEGEEQEKAGSPLIDTKNMKVDDETKAESDKLSSDLNKKNIWDIYNEGNRLYKQGKYEEALPKLKIAYEVKPDLELMPWITYQIGNSYKETGDNANALVFFQKVKENYPNSRYVSSAERAINQIENNKVKGN